MCGSAEMGLSIDAKFVLVEFEKTSSSIQSLWWEMNNGRNKSCCLFLTVDIGDYGLLFIAILRECLSLSLCIEGIDAFVAYCQNCYLRKNCVLKF